MLLTLGQDACPGSGVSRGGTSLLSWLGHTSHDPKPNYPISPPEICYSNPTSLPPSPFHSGLFKHSRFRMARAPTGHKVMLRNAAPLLLLPPAGSLWTSPAWGDVSSSPAAGTAGRATSSCQGHLEGCRRELGAAPCCSSGSGPGAAWCSGSGCTGASSAPTPKRCCPCGSPAVLAPWMEKE